MRLKVISTPRSDGIAHGYSPAVAVEGAQRLTFFSTITSSHTLSVSEEARDVVDQLKALLDAAGLTADNLIRLTLYARDLAAAPKVHAELARIIASRHPALTEIEVSSLPHGRSVAIEAVAAS
jgi:2-iminobutanoate/2-iminopropanoate deaminase